jgi:hypothetical protein
MTLTSTSRSEHYEPARRTNIVLRIFGEVLLHADAADIFHEQGTYKYLYLF